MSLNLKPNKEEIFLKRVVIIFWLVVFIFVVFVGKLFDISIFSRSKLLSEFAPQVVPSYDILRAERGEILDRNGVTLATNEITFELDVNPSLIPENKVSALKTILKDKLKLSSAAIETTFKSNSYVLVSTTVPKDVKDSIEALKCPDGIVFTQTYKRIYPFGEILAPLVGVVGVDNSGLSGLEFSLNDYLKGRNGRAFRTFSYAEPDILGAPTYILNPESGCSIELTIDANIQAKVYELVKQYVESFNAKSGFAIVTDPLTNEILAMVSYPSFDPTNFKTIAPNLPTSFNYEPGSIMKPVVAIAALDEGKLNPDDSFYCPGYIKVKDRVISCWQKHGNEHGLVDIMVNSCDVAFASIGLRVGKQTLIDYFKLFGFGETTQLEIAGEEAGILPDVNKIGDVELANMAFGQGIAVTQIQMITALNAITNDGKLCTPHIIKRITNSNGKVVYESETVVKQIIGTQANIDLVKSAMVQVVEEGAPRARIEGYKVMGKTGTAQKPSSTGGYSRSKLIYSFYGAIPYPAPQVSVIVSINETAASQYSTTVSAPLFSQIGQFLVKYLRIAK